MKKPSRWLPNAVTGVSLLLCGAAAVLWASSYAYDGDALWAKLDEATTPTRTTVLEAESVGGALYLRWLSVDWADVVAGRSVRTTYDQLPHPLGGPVALAVKRHRSAMTEPQYGYNTTTRAGPYGTLYARTVTLPYSLLLMVAAIPAIGRAMLAGRRKRRAGFCPTCSYEYAGNVSGFCPGCGTAVAEGKA